MLILSDFMLLVVLDVPARCSQSYSSLLHKFLDCMLALCSLALRVAQRHDETHDGAHKKPA